MKEKYIKNPEKIIAYNAAFRKGFQAGQKAERELRIYHVDCEECINKGKSQQKKEILNMINKARDEGNIEVGENKNNKTIYGFSAGLFLSELIKYLEGRE